MKYCSVSHLICHTTKTTSTSVKQFDEIPFPRCKQLPAFAVKVYWNNHNNGKIRFQNHESRGEMDKIVLLQRRGCECNQGLAITSSARQVP